MFLMLLVAITSNNGDIIQGTFYFDACNLMSTPSLIHVTGGEFRTRYVEDMSSR